MADVPERASEIYGPTKFSYLYANSYEALLAVSAVLSGIGFFFGGKDAVEQTSIGKQLSGFMDEAWNISYILGGILVVIGLITIRSHHRIFNREVAGGAIELAGLWLLNTAVLVNIVAIFIQIGLVPTTMVYVAFFICNLLRARALLAGKARLVIIEVPERNGK